MNKERKIFIGMIAGLLAGIVVGLMVDKVILLGILGILIGCLIGLSDRFFPKYSFIDDTGLFIGAFIGIIIGIIINYFIFGSLFAMVTFFCMILTLFFMILIGSFYKEKEEN